MLLITQGKTNVVYILIVVILTAIAGGGVWWYSIRQEVPYQPSEIQEPAEVYETADWNTYRNEEYGFEVKYPLEATALSYGPNVAQQAIDRGEQISGTVTPSLDTIVFSDTNGQLGAIGIFHKREKGITVEDYDDGYLYLSGPCDLRWGFNPDSVRLGSIDDTIALIVEGEMIIKEEIVSYNHCYYLKNPTENLIVISNEGYKEEVFNQILSTFKFIEEEIIEEDGTTEAEGVLINKKFTYPYPLEWRYEHTKTLFFDYSLTGVSLGKRTVPSFVAHDSPYKPGTEVHALTLYFKIRNIGTHGAGVCLNVDLRLVLNEEGDLVSPINNRFNADCLWDGQTYYNQEVIFVVPENQREFNLTTGGESNIFFEVEILDDGDLRIERIITNGLG